METAATANQDRDQAEHDLDSAERMKSVDLEGMCRVEIGTGGLRDFTRRALSPR